MKTSHLGCPTFTDIEGKLEVLQVECTKCDRKGRYSVARPIAKHGPQGPHIGLGVKPERRLP